MRNVTNYFLVNLSMADLMMSCLNTIFNFIFMKNRYVIILMRTKETQNFEISKGNHPHN